MDKTKSRANSSDRRSGLGALKETLVAQCRTKWGRFRAMDRDQVVHWSLITVSFLLAVVTASLAAVTWSLYRVTSIQEKLTVAGESEEPTLTASMRVVPSLIVHTVSDHGEKLTIFCVAAPEKFENDALISDLRTNGLVRPMAGQVDRTMNSLVVPCVEYPVSTKYFDAPRYIYAFLAYTAAIFNDDGKTLNWTTHVYEYDSSLHQYRSADLDKVAFARGVALTSTFGSILSDASTIPFDVGGSIPGSPAGATIAYGSRALITNQVENLAR